MPFTKQLYICLRISLYWKPLFLILVWNVKIFLYWKSSNLSNADIKLILNKLCSWSAQNTGQSINPDNWIKNIWGKNKELKHISIREDRSLLVCYCSTRSVYFWEETFKVNKWESSVTKLMWLSDWSSVRTLTMT